MFNQFKIITLSHHEASPEEVKYALFPQSSAEDNSGIEAFKRKENIDEMLYLATCNRVIYMFYDQRSADELKSLLYTHIIEHGASPEFESLWHKAKTYTGMDAMKHYIRIASSMDSMVIGEREIFRQLREAYDLAAQIGISGDHLRLVQQSTVKAAKRIYSESRIGERPVSVVSLAMRKFKERNLPRESRIILIGAGTTIERASKFLLADDYQNVTIYNRSLDTAQRVADQFSGSTQVLSLAELGKSQESFDCIISCTAAQDCLLDTPKYATLIGEDNSAKLIIDLAVPEDISREIPEQFNVELIGLNDLTQLAKANMEFRKRELLEADKILDEELKAFTELVHRRFIERAFVSVPKQVEMIKKRAINEVFAAELEEVDVDTRDLINRMMDYMEKKCVSIPMKTAREQYTRIKKSLAADAHQQQSK